MTPSGTDGKPVTAVVVRVVVAEAEKGKGAGKQAKGGRKFLVLCEWEVPSPCFFVANWGDWQRIPIDEGKGWDGQDPDEHDALAAALGKDEMAKIEEVCHAGHPAPCSPP